MEFDSLLDKKENMNIKSAVKKILIWLIVIFLVTSPIFVYIV